MSSWVGQGPINWNNICLVNWKHILQFFGIFCFLLKHQNAKMWFQASKQIKQIQTSRCLPQSKPHQFWLQKKDHGCPPKQNGERNHHFFYVNLPLFHLWFLNITKRYASLKISTPTLTSPGDPTSSSLCVFSWYHVIIPRVPLHLRDICRLDPGQISTQIIGIQIIVVEGDIANDLQRGSFTRRVWKRSHNPTLKGRKLTMVINHLLTGMICKGSL